MSQASRKKVQAEPPSQRPIHWPSALQFAFSALAVLGLWSIGAGALGLGLFELLSGRSEMGVATAYLISGEAMIFLGFLVAPSALLALMRLLGRPVALPSSVLKLATRFNKALPLLVAAALALGAWAAQSSSLSWLALPPIHVLAVSLIVAAILWWATQGLWSGSQQRNWGVLAAGIGLGPALAIILEILVGVFFLLAGALYLSTQPDLANTLLRVVERAQFSVPDAGELLSDLEPLLSDPFVLALALGFAAGVVPLVEELFKPIGVWLLLNRELSEAEGFALGVLSGAGFALFESLTIGASAEGWLSITTARIGTTVMHLFTAGLMGWGLVAARRRKRPLRLLGAYAASVSLHALWNGMVVLAGFASASGFSPEGLVPPHLVVSSFLVLLVLAAGTFGLLKLGNRRLASPPSEESGAA